MSSIRISKAEWAVMLVLWDKSPKTAADICEHLRHNSIENVKTIRTYINRLVAKGALYCEKTTKEYLFSPRVSKDKCIQEEGEQFLSKVFRGVTMSLLTHFISTKEMTPKEIQELKQLVTSKERQFHDQ